MLLLARPDSARSRVLASLPHTSRAYYSITCFRQGDHPSLIQEGSDGQRRMAARASVPGDLVCSERCSSIFVVRLTRLQLLSPLPYFSQVRYTWGEFCLGVVH